MSSKYIPNLITAVNLTAGVLSLVFLMADNYTGAALLVLMATILDSMDGRVARRLQASSLFGKELDSLADLVSFGVAPALLAYAVALVPLGIPGLAAAIIFVVCGALRLARFNSTTFSGKFEGVPITVAGGLMALLMLVDRNLNGGVVLVLMLGLSFLMVSRISVPKF
ncbi:CDP-diacylglycerol--serine O-phosphatidyltransferase [Desulfohalotomaculum tongense]|uniref:CDP-diacylglycerol--serine O-phosphatidyltransferase n=1 Tax=Desulforadius tongensis TaxID=1216062 RepID=UPI00195A8EFC|nr:CDP-diacylglycerol--serine O-phosphatidyltransferase [Desulforadius tongensis]MBM7855310.1 CDP-diacylglycerol--serine O-phosphatidyltransferase [Desulforadius tongensis]